MSRRDAPGSKFVHRDLARQKGYVGTRKISGERGAYARVCYVAMIDLSSTRRADRAHPDKNENRGYVEADDTQDVEFKLSNDCSRRKF